MKTVPESSHEVHAFVQDGQDDGWPPGLRHAEDEMFSAGSHAQARKQKTHVLADHGTLSDGLGGLLGIGVRS